MEGIFDASFNDAGVWRAGDHHDDDSIFDNLFDVMRNPPTPELFS